MEPPVSPVGRWLDERTRWLRVRDRLASVRVRPNDPVYYIAGLVVFLLWIQAATGGLLLLHYQPNTAEAHASLRRIIGGIPYGDLIRNMHLWSSDLLVLGAALGLFLVAIRRIFRAPNELRWIWGLIAFFVLLGLAFTGAVLPWSEHAYLQARVGSDIVGQTPWIGGFLRYFMRGGEEVGSMTLRHAYGFHVAILPAALTFVVIGFGVLLRGRRLREAASADDVELTIPVYPDLLLRILATMTGALAVLISLATFVDRPLGEAADPTLAAPLGARPPWYLLFVHDLVIRAPRELLGVPSAQFIVGVLALLVVLTFFVPLLDRKGSRITAVLATVLLLLAATLSIHALF
jgi:quinol-cytochrome oxidoreductase complex cytochrome b subunit